MSESNSGSLLMKGCILSVFLGGLVAILAAAGAFLMSSQPAAVNPGAPAPSAAGEARSAAGGDDASPAAAQAAAQGEAVARIQARGHLRVGMDTGEPAMAGTPPMFFVDAQGGRDGFDYALARRIARELGVNEVELVHAKYSALEDQLLDGSGQVDLLISGYSPTDTAGISWSQPYLEYGLCLVVPTSSPVRTTQDLFGRKIGIFDDDSAAEEVQKLVKGYTELVRMEDGYWEALLAGRFDAFLYDYPYTVAELQQFAADHPAQKGAFRIAQYNLTDSTYAVGVRSADADLLAVVDGAIAAWRASDEYGQAVKRYLRGGEATAVSSPTARKVTVKPGDTLSGIAQRELGSPGRWKEVWELNRSRFPNPHLIEVGDEVELPAA